MNVSFELLSSMSPKVNKYQNPIRKTPSVLALKKYFRKSIDLPTAKSPVKDISVVSVRSTSSSANSENVLNATPIVISDSEKSFDKRNTPRKFYTPKPSNGDFSSPSKSETRLSKEKYTDICQWVDKVNSAKRNSSDFSEVSTILGDDIPGFKKSGANVAASSTLLHSNVKRFDELFCKSASKTDMNGKSPARSLENDKTTATRSNSLENDIKDLEDSFRDVNIDDSFVMNGNESLSSRIQKKIETEQLQHISVDESREYEILLDGLYGTSWRAKKEDVLPSSEPRRKKPSIEKNIPQSERHLNKISDKNLLKILQKTRFKKTLEYPYREKLKNICDSDTESEENSEKFLPRIKLNFEDDDRSSKNMLETKRKITNKCKVNVPDQNHKSDVETLSFLASLSGNVPVEKCDTSALIFRKNFKQHKEALAVKLFALFNKNVFENAIPEDTPVEWSDRMVRTAGTCTCKKITRRNGDVYRTAKLILSSKVLDSADRLRDTLIHEMCHAATWIVNKVSDGHGSFWKAWAHHAMKTFPELPPIKRCHNYVINTKYTYKCVGCGYSIGRHTKSLDVERKRCGYCLGTFEVLINKTSKQGETKSVPATPKKVSGFALFVKENYASFKTPDLKHGEIMKILGRKFASLKVDQS